MHIYIYTYIYIVQANLLAIPMNSHSNLRLSAPDLGADPRVPGGPGERTRDAGDEVGRPARALVQQLVSLVVQQLGVSIRPGRPGTQNGWFTWNIPNNN